MNENFKKASHETQVYHEMIGWSEERFIELQKQFNIALHRGTITNSGQLLEWCMAEAETKEELAVFVHVCTQILQLWQNKMKEKEERLQALRNRLENLKELSPEEGMASLMELFRIIR